MPSIRIPSCSVRVSALPRDDDEEEELPKIEAEADFFPEEEDLVSVETGIVGNSLARTELDDGEDDETLIEAEQDIESEEVSVERQKSDDERSWWQVFYPKAESLMSEDEFLKYRPFLDNFVFDEYDWTMEEIIEHGWDAIKVWRWNAAYQDFGDVKPDQTEFASEAMMQASEQKVDEPQINIEWTRRLTAGVQRNASKQVVPEAPIFRVFKRDLAGLKWERFPKPKGARVAATIEIEKAERLKFLVREAEEFKLRKGKRGDSIEALVSDDDKKTFLDLINLQSSASEKCKGSEPQVTQFFEDLDPQLSLQLEIFKVDEISSKDLYRLLESTNKGASFAESYFQETGTPVPQPSLQVKEQPELNSMVLVPPRDWPPPGWQVDPAELEFIHGGEEEEFIELGKKMGKFEGKSLEEFKEFVRGKNPRFFKFLEHYEEWVGANKSKLDEEAKIVRLRGDLREYQISCLDSLIAPRNLICQQFQGCG